MAETKTKPTDVNVDDFIATVDNERKRSDARELVAMMRRITGEEPVMWGPTMIGFGRYHYKYDSGHEGDAFVTGFSPRKSALTIYVMCDDPGNQDLMERIGKHKHGKCCLYVNKLDDIDRSVLEELVKREVEWVRRKYPTP